MAPVEGVILGLEVILVLGVVDRVLVRLGVGVVVLLVDLVDDALVVRLLVTVLV